MKQMKQKIISETSLCPLHLPYTPPLRAMNYFRGSFSRKIKAGKHNKQKLKVSCKSIYRRAEGKIHELRHVRQLNADRSLKNFQTFLIFIKSQISKFAYFLSTHVVYEPAQQPFSTVQHRKELRSSFYLRNFSVYLNFNLKVQH